MLILYQFILWKRIRLKTNLGMSIGTSGIPLGSSSLQAIDEWIGINVFEPEKPIANSVFDAGDEVLMVSDEPGQTATARKPV